METEIQEKTFTQEEVNKIVSDRLARERAKVDEAKTNANEQRENELTARENRLACKEYLLDNGYSTELLDCVDTSDIETFKNKVETIQKIQRPLHTPQPRSSERPAEVRAYAEAFRKNVKHKPAKY